MKKEKPLPGTSEYYTDPRRPLWPHFAGMLLPLAVCSVGLYFGITSIRAGIDAETTDGVVAFVKKRRDTDDRIAEMVVAKYKVDGREYQCDGSVWWGGWSAYRVGDRIRILYKVESPSSAVIDNFWERWLTAIFFLACGSFVWGYLIRVLVQHIRNKRAAAQKKEPKDSSGI